MFLSSMVDAQLGTYFQFKERVFTTHDAWVISYSVTLVPYRDHINSLWDEITVFRNSVSQLRNKNITRKNPFRLNLLKLIDQEISLFQEQYNNIHENYNSVFALTGSKGRYRRSIFPFLGTILNSITGVATDSDMREVRNKMIKLKNSQEAVIHVVEQGISMINQTHKEVEQNRISINKMIQITSKISSKFTELYRQITSMTQPEIVYLKMIAKVHEIFHIVSSSMSETTHSVEALCEQIQQAINGKLSITLVSPKDLKNTLRSIGSKLRDSLSLPFDINKEIVKYYQLLKTQVAVFRDHFNILLKIPLIKRSQKFEIMEAFTIPVIKPSLKLAAQYQVDSKYIALSIDRLRYIHLSDIEALNCINGIGICTITSPIYNAMSAPSCTYALFSKRSDLVNQFCRKELRPYQGIPTVKNLFQNVWLISSNETNYQYRINCQKQKKSFQKKRIDNFTFIIALNNSCSLISRDFTIPSTQVLYSNQKIISELFKDINLSEAMPNVWKDIEPILSPSFEINNISASIPSILKPINSLPLQNLHDILQSSMTELQSISFKKHESYIFYIVIGSIVGLLVLIGTVFLCYKFYPSLNSKFKKKKYSVEKEACEPIELSALQGDKTPALENNTKAQSKPSAW